ncbi:MoxY protein [Uncinocarpus reesii 1704]|uniref:MoxY protein n=1 Tax=Uncinocarpus reesii (strain UAMH 1704) TaxID=336963 RepID=C4JL83_UNCRE|nr:MoxY protein [Uncinocarpus reesii 1704]EEP78745.1 MoxY protein [Uncinocarpus reesii 1704]
MAEWIRDKRKAVAKFTENGLLGEDGIEREADTIVCATGFDTSYRPRFPIIGEGGLGLAEKWKSWPESYLGLAIPGQGSVIGPLVEVGNDAVKLIKKIQNEYIRAIAPRQDVTDAFNEHVQEWVKHTVWSDDCPHFLGLGKVLASVAEGYGRSPYLFMEAIDPAWLDEIQGRGRGTEAKIGPDS